MLIDQGPKYIGCFRDTSDRDLTGQWTDGLEVTNEVCIARCARQVLTIVGVDSVSLHYSAI